MAQTLGSVIIDVQADTQKLVQGFDKAEKRVNKATKTISNAIKTMAVSYLSFQGVNAFSSMIKGSIDAADKLGKLSEKLAISAQSLSELQYAAGFADVSISQLNAAMGAMIRRTGNFKKDGTGAAVKAMEELGISVDFARANFTDTETIFRLLIDRLGSVEDSMLRTKIAQDLFSKSAADVVRLANLGSKELDNYAEIGRKLGVVITDDMAAASAKLNDDLSVLNSKLDGFKITLANDLIPVLNELVTFLDENGKSIIETTKQLGMMVTSLIAVRTAITASSKATALYTAAMVALNGSITSLNSKILLATISMKAFSKALNLSGIGLAAGAVMTLANSFLEAKKSAESFKGSLDLMESKERLEDVNKQLEEINERSKNWTLEEKIRLGIPSAYDKLYKEKLALEKNIELIEKRNKKEKERSSVIGDPKEDISEDENKKSQELLKIQQKILSVLDPQQAQVNAINEKYDLMVSRVRELKGVTADIFDIEKARSAELANINIGNETMVAAVDEFYKRTDTIEKSLERIKSPIEKVNEEFMSMHEIIKDVFDTKQLEKFYKAWDKELAKDRDRILDDLWDSLGVENEVDGVISVEIEYKGLLDIGDTVTQAMIDGIEGSGLEDLIGGLLGKSGNALVASGMGTASSSINSFIGGESIAGLGSGLATAGAGLAMSYVANAIITGTQKTETLLVNPLEKIVDNTKEMADLLSLSLEVSRASAGAFNLSGLNISTGLKQFDTSVNNPTGYFLNGQWKGAGGFDTSNVFDIEQTGSKQIYEQTKAYFEKFFDDFSDETVLIHKETIARESKSWYGKVKKTRDAYLEEMSLSDAYFELFTNMYGDLEGDGISKLNSQLSQLNSLTSKIESEKPLSEQAKIIEQEIADGLTILNNLGFSKDINLNNFGDMYSLDSVMEIVANTGLEIGTVVAQFDNLYDSMKELETIQDQLNQVKKDEKDLIQQEADSLQQQLDLLKGVITQRDIEAESVKETNRHLIEAIHAEQDRQAELEESNRIMLEKQGLEREWLTLIGDTASLRALELKELDKSNYALQEKIWAYQDQQEAEREAEEARQEAIQRANEIAEAEKYLAEVRATAMEGEFNFVANMEDLAKTFADAWNDIIDSIQDFINNRQIQTFIEDNSLGQIESLLNASVALFENSKTADEASGYGQYITEYAAGALEIAKATAGSKESYRFYEQSLLNKLDDIEPLDAEQSLEVQQTNYLKDIKELNDKLVTGYEKGLWITGLTKQDLIDFGYITDRESETISKGGLLAELDYAQQADISKVTGLENLNDIENLHTNLLSLDLADTYTKFKEVFSSFDNATIEYIAKLRDEFDDAYVGDEALGFLQQLVNMNTKEIIPAEMGIMEVANREEQAVVDYIKTLGVDLANKETGRDYIQGMNYSTGKYDFTQSEMETFLTNLLGDNAKYDNIQYLLNSVGLDSDMAYEQGFITKELSELTNGLLDRFTIEKDNYGWSSETGKATVYELKTFADEEYEKRPEYQVDALGALAPKANYLETLLLEYGLTYKNIDDEIADLNDDLSKILNNNSLTANQKLEALKAELSTEGAFVTGLGDLEEEINTILNDDTLAPNKKLENVKTLLDENGAIVGGLKDLGVDFGKIFDSEDLTINEKLQAVKDALNDTGAIVTAVNGISASFNSIFNDETTWIFKKLEDINNSLNGDGDNSLGSKLDSLISAITNFKPIDIPTYNPVDPVEYIPFYDELKTTYNKLFGRDPDSGGAYYWSNKLVAGDIPLNQLIPSLIKGALGEDKIYYENNKEDINKWTVGNPLGSYSYEDAQVKGVEKLPYYESMKNIYNELFDRAPDVRGAIYWSNELANNKVTLDDLRKALIDGAKGADRTTLDEKGIVDSSTYYKDIDKRIKSINDFLFSLDYELGKNTTDIEENTKDATEELSKIDGYFDDLGVDFGYILNSPTLTSTKKLDLIVAGLGDNGAIYTKIDETLGYLKQCFEQKEEPKKPSNTTAHKPRPSVDYVDEQGIGHFEQGVNIIGGGFGGFLDEPKLGGFAFADGGIVTKPTLGLIGEAGYSEAVIPLKNPNDPLSMNNVVKELKAIREISSNQEQRIAQLQKDNTKMRKILEREEIVRLSA
jgi:hypothetical protein